MAAYTETETLLTIDNVSKDYDGKTILKSVNAVIKDIHVEGTVTGQIVGFIGPSGLGKSTLFRIMAGLEKPSSGSIKLKGEIEVKAGDVGVVAQNYPLFAHRTVMSNLMLAANKSVPKLSTKEQQEKVITYLNDFDLSAEANHYPCQLSGGQKQRCAILQQILCSNHFILMDEPFSGLDPIAKKKTEDLIRKIANMDELNTIIIVTHDIRAAAEISDHLWVMGRDHQPDGKIIPGAFIVKTYNLIDKGFAWHPETLEANSAFHSFVTEINNLFPSL